MTRTSIRLVMVCALAAVAGGALLAGQGRASAPAKGATIWTATPAEATRIARVEAGLAAVKLASGAPITLDVAGWMRALNVPGISVAVFDDFRVVWAKTYGAKEAGTPGPVTLDTLFQAGSISKPVTALAALHHVERGRFSLDEDINGRLRSWKVPDNELTRAEKVTLRRLLSHSAGLTVHGFPGYATSEPVPTVVQVLDGAKPANTAPIRVDLVPGTRFRYSGGGTTVLQLALVDQLGKPFPAILDETVFTPLALHDSTFLQPLPPDRAAQAAAGHRRDGTVVEGRWHVYPEMAAAGLWTTPWDLAQVAIEVAQSKAGRSNRILSQQMVRLMLTPQAGDAGLGFFVDASKKTDRFGHGGADEGFQAFLEAYAATGRGVAVMTNSDNGFAAMQPLVDSIAREYQWPGHTPRDPDVQRTVAIVSRLRGLDAALTEYAEMGKVRPAADFSPAQLNSFGYSLLAEKRVDDAIRVFRLNVELYPRDANAYDSLGEAYMVAGKNDLAIANYRTSLDLDPTNENGVAMLRKLGVEWKAGAAAGRQSDQESAVLRPGDNLTVAGIPPIPLSVVQDVGRYTEFRSAGFRAWHPTRVEMLIGTRFADTVQLHRVTMPGGARTQLTFFPDRVGGAIFQPTHGEYFVFSKDVGGGEWYQNYRYDLASGDVTQLTDGKSRNSLGRWSNRGDRMVYTSTRRTGKDNDFYVIDPTDPRSDRLLARVEGGGWFPVDWSPDDRQILAAEYISVNESYLWLVDAGSGQMTLVTPKGGAEKVSYQGGQFSRDGKGIYVATDKDSEFQRLAYVDLARKDHRYLTTHVDWDVEDFDLSDDGKTVAFVTNEDGISVLRLLDTATGKERPAPKTPTGVIGGIEWHKDSRHLAFGLESARSPSDVYSLDAGSGTIDRWTRSETGGVNAEGFSEPELVGWKSFDGRRITGFLYRPPARFTGKRPVIVNIHGGPEGQARPGYLGRTNYYVNELGVAVIFPNVRGSAGYGKTFLTLDNALLREDSYKDVNALFDWIATRPDLDAGKVLVTGGSYGGFMTFAIATNYDARICCSISVVGISNLRTFLERTEAYRRDLRRAEYGDERDPKTREFFERIAAVNNAQRITKPIFVVQGRNDPRVPWSESQQIVDTLQQQRTPVWYLLAADEGHGFAKKKNADFQFYASVMFVRRYLLGQGG